MMTDEEVVNGITEQAEEAPDAAGEDTVIEGEAATGEAETAAPDTATDYERVVREDILALRESFSECRNSLTDISELKNPIRFAALRDLGLSPAEAYLATGGLKRTYDSRAHLGGTVPASASGGVDIPRAEYEIAKDLFSDMSDTDIRKLYRRVTK